jgi:hypothetical protein
MIANVLNEWIGGALAWLWNWTEFLAYWIAAIGGSSTYILYVTTKDKKFMTYTIGAIVGYTIICIIGSVV